MKLRVLGVIACIIFFTSCDKDNSEVPNTPEPENETLCVSVQEKALYDLIMEYRAEHNLEAIPLTFSMTTVAKAHATDLKNNASSFSSECNNHSWSDDGAWTGCCYTPDHANPGCMWDKPRELSNYTGNGFENVCWGFQNATGALDLWKNSEAHNALILNLGIWENDWNAIGIGMDGIYATAWFGHSEDPDGTIGVCP